MNGIIASSRKINISSNLYSYTNAVSDDDINSNANWSDTSIFFAKSMVSTSVGSSYSIGIESRSTSTTNTSSLSHTLPTLSIGTKYVATITYKNTAVNVPVQNPFFNWNNVSGTTYPTTFSNGNWVQVDVLFTPTSTNPTMRIYPHWNNSGGRTLGDVLEISNITIVENL
jgi:hypothetical protein